jgi:dienelactone hydrolase
MQLTLPGPRTTPYTRRALRVLLVVLFAPVGFSPASHGLEYVQFKASNFAQSEQVLLTAQLYRPHGAGPFPAVVLMHGCGGWQPAVLDALQAHAEFLVRHGFAVLNLDSFGPRKKTGGQVCESWQLLQDARFYRTYDAFDALRYLQAQDFIEAQNVFLMGQSNGGSVAIKAALASDPHAYGRAGAAFRAVVAYYPWCGIFEQRSLTLASPLLIFGGGLDDWAPPHQCAQAKASGAPLQVKIYPRAVHSFDVDIVAQRYLGRWIGKNAYATSDSRERMLAFFKEHLLGIAAEYKPHKRSISVSLQNPWVFEMAPAIRRCSMTHSESLRPPSRSRLVGHAHLDAETTALILDAVHI